MTARKMIEYNDPNRVAAGIKAAATRKRLAAERAAVAHTKTKDMKWVLAGRKAVKTRRANKEKAEALAALRDGEPLTIEMANTARASLLAELSKLNTSHSDMTAAIVVLNETIKAMAL